MSERKNIALHISGLIRRESLGFEQIQKNILQPNAKHNIDIYLHIWSNKMSKYENFSGEWRTERRESLSFSDHHDLNEIYRLYKPVAFAVESDEAAELFKDMSSLVKNGQKEKSTPYAILSQYYKMLQVNNLRKSRARALNIKYDICVRTREELKYENPIFLDDFEVDDKKLFVEVDREPLDWISDKFAIASPEVFDKYSELYLNFLNINSEQVAAGNNEVVKAEKYMSHWTKEKLNLEVVKDGKIGTLGRW